MRAFVFPLLAMGCVHNAAGGSIEVESRYGGPCVVEVSLGELTPGRLDYKEIFVLSPSMPAAFPEMSTGWHQVFFRATGTMCGGLCLFPDLAGPLEHRNVFVTYGSASNVEVTAGAPLACGDTQPVVSLTRVVP